VYKFLLLATKISCYVWERLVFKAVDAHIVNFVFYLVFDRGITQFPRNTIPPASTSEVKLQDWRVV